MFRLLAAGAGLGFLGAGLGFLGAGAGGVGVSGLGGAFRIAGAFGGLLLAGVLGGLRLLLGGAGILQLLGQLLAEAFHPFHHGEGHLDLSLAVGLLLLTDLQEQGAGLDLALLGLAQVIGNEAGSGGTEQRGFDQLFHK